jgi:DHA2 family multidrug resistance protein-like MFS transporter
MNRTPDARRWWALGAICLGLLAVGLDVTVLSLALSTLASALHATESDLQWFVTAYTLALVAAMLPAGLVGDRYGRRAVLLGALVVFGAASVACAYSASPIVFIMARAVLGLAGAAMVVMALSVITVMFSEGERPRAIGIWGAANFLAMPIGPVLGGWMLAHVWWGWVFLVNVPVVLVGMTAVVLLVPESRATVRPRIDWPGVIGSSAGLALLMYGVIEAGRLNWGDAAALIPLGAGLAVLALFVAWERAVTRRGDQPLVDLGLFRSRGFTWGVALAGLAIFGLFGALFVLPQYWQGVLGLDAQGAGFRLLPMIFGMVLGAVPADRIAARIGSRLTVAAGFVALAAAMAVGSTMVVASSDAFQAAWTLAAGFGAGLGLATAASAALVELDVERSGVGSALVQAVTKLGPAFGATILGSVLISTYQSLVPLAGIPPEAAAAARASVFGGLTVAREAGSPALADAVRTAFVAGMDNAFRVEAVIASASVVLALAFLPRRLSAASEDGAQSVHEPATSAS